MSRVMSQTQLATAAQVSLPTIVKVERGERVPGPLIRAALAAGLGISGGELEAIAWPSAYTAQNYNHRIPKFAETGSMGEQLKQIRLAKGFIQPEQTLRWRGNDCAPAG